MEKCDHNNWKVEIGFQAKKDGDEDFRFSDIYLRAKCTKCRHWLSHEDGDQLRRAAESALFLMQNN